MEFDAMSAGVDPGGLFSRADIRLAVCYMLSGIDAARGEQIAEILQNDGLANYFEVLAVIEDLERSGAITPGGDGYSLSETGRQAARQLDSALPLRVRDQVTAAALRIGAEARRKKENDARIERVSGGYMVTCAVRDADKILMTAGLLAADQLQAETIRRRFLDDPAAVYSGLIRLLTEDNPPAERTDEA